MAIFCDEVQTSSDFSYTTSCRCWQTRAPVWTNFGWLTAKGGVSTSTTTALLLSSRCTNQNFCHLACTLHLRHIEARIFDVLFKTLYDWGSLPHKYVHDVCVWPMWGAGMSIWHDHVHANNSWLATERLSGNPRRPHKTSAVTQFLATIV